MKSVTTNFFLANNAPSKTPIYAVNISFDSANTDTHWIGSVNISGLDPGISISQGALKSISGTSQQLNQRSGISTIGAISFSAVDKDLDLSDLQRDKLAAGDGLRGKRVQVFITYDNIDLIADASQISTQIIDEVSYKDGLYTFKCRDVQRYLKTSIFDVKKTGLASSIGESSTTLTVYSTDGFEMVKHPASATGKIDAPGQKVGYLKLTKDRNFEIVRYTGKTSTTFTGVTRGVFGTTPVAIDTAGSSSVDDAPKIEEYIYLEGPAVRILYELLTGYVWNEGGEQLPSHWTPSIAPEYIRSSNFTLIGFDLWNLTDNEEGPFCKIAGVTKTDCKKFIESEFLLRLGLYTPIYANGEIGLKRRSQIVSESLPVRTLTADNIISYSELTHSMQDVINQISIDWNYDERKKDYTRRNLLIDTSSIATHGANDPLELELRTVYGDKTTYETLKSQFDSLRDRFAGPPLELQLTLLPSQNDLEVGDIVRVNLDQIRDYNNATISLDRNFEITQTNVDWVSGNVVINLIGSSQAAGALAPESSGVALQDSWYSSVGTEINATNFPGAVSSAGGVTTINSNINLAGHTDLRENAAVYYCTEDLTIALGATVTINNNVFLRIKGFFQINGTIDGKGRGLAGGVGTDSAGEAANRGQYGAFGASQAQDGIRFKIGYAGSPYHERRDEASTIGTAVNLSYIHPSGSTPDPLIPGVLSLATVAAGAGLVGVPSDLRGSSGCAGGPVFIDEESLSPGGVAGDFNPAVLPANHWHKGGDGGNGGAAMLIVVRLGAAFGASGLIDTSGEDGSEGVTYQDPWFGGWLRSGAGGGGVPGAVYWVMDGATATPPDLNATKAIANLGASPITLPDRAAVPINQTPVRKAFPDATGGAWDDHAEPYAWSSKAVGLYGNNPQNAWAAAHRVQFLTGYFTPKPDITGDAERPASILLNELTNTPVTAAGNLSTIEVSVTAPSDTNYAYSLVDYRVVGSESWTLAILAQATPEALIVVASDGTNYEVRARSVSKFGVIAPDGISTTIVVTDLTNPTQAEADLVAPFLAITNLRLQDGGGAVFGGRDAKFAWDNENKGVLTFLEYKVEILDTGSDVVRTETISDPFFVYTNEKNREDYFAENATLGIHRQFTIRVTAIGRIETTTGKHAGTPVTLAVSNTAPGAFSNVSVDVGFSQIVVEFDNPTDIDYKHVQVYVGTTTGFTPGPSNLKAVSTDNHIIIGGLLAATDYYVVLEPWDEFGAGTLSSEYSVTTLEVSVSGLSNWAYETSPADAAFIAANVNNSAISSDKIASLVAGKIVAGTITATVGLGTGGIIEVVNGSYKVRLGAHTLDSKTAMMSYAIGTTRIFAVNSDGTLRLGGTTDNYMEWTGSALNIYGDFSTSTGSGKRFVMNKASNEAIFYGDRGTGTVLELLRIGLSSTAGGTSILKVGEPGTSRNAIFAESDTAIGVYGKSDDSHGVRGESAQSYGGYFTSTNNIAVYGNGGGGPGDYGGYFIGYGGVYALGDGGGAGIYADGNTSGYGVDAVSSTSYAVRGISTSGWAGWFQGASRGIYGKATSSSGVGLDGTCTASGGIGVRGIGYSSTNGMGIRGEGYYGGFFTNAVTATYHYGSIYSAYLAGGALGPFTAAHDGLLANTESPEIGDILDYGAVENAQDVNNVIHRVTPCSTANCKTAAGVYIDTLALEYETRPAGLGSFTESQITTLAATHDVVVFNALGEGLMQVCDDGGDIAAGDLLTTSATTGKAQKQSDDIQRNYTIGRAREAVDWSAESPATTKLISVIYLFG